MLRFVLLSVSPMPLALAQPQQQHIFGLWLQQNTNRKFSARSRTHWSPLPYSTATESSCDGYLLGRCIFS